MTSLEGLSNKSVSVQDSKMQTLAAVTHTHTLCSYGLFRIPWSNRPVVVRKEQRQCEGAARNRSEADMPISLR